MNLKIAGDIIYTSKSWGHAESFQNLWRDYHDYS